MGDRYARRRGHLQSGLLITIFGSRGDLLWGGAGEGRFGRVPGAMTVAAQSPAQSWSLGLSTLQPMVPDGFTCFTLATMGAAVFLTKTDAKTQ